MRNNNITQARLKELLHYDPDSGVFTWRQSKNNQYTRIGSEADCVSGHGYIRIMLDGTRYFAHVLAWLYVYGKYPTQVIDHINKIKSDNRIINLRDVSTSINNHNTKARKDNTSGQVGVNWHKRTGKWAARLCVDNKRQFLGYYDNYEDAVNIYKTEKDKIL